MTNLEPWTNLLNKEDLSAIFRLINSVKTELNYKQMNNDPMYIAYTCCMLDRQLSNAFMRGEAKYVFRCIRDKLVNPFLVHAYNNKECSVTGLSYKDCESLQYRLELRSSNFIYNFLDDYLVGVTDKGISNSVADIPTHPHNIELYNLKLEWLNFLENYFKSLL